MTFAPSHFDHLDRHERDSSSWCEGAFEGLCNTRVYDTHGYFGRIHNFASLALGSSGISFAGVLASLLVISHQACMVSAALWKHGMDCIFNFHFMYQAYVFTMLYLYISKKINGEE